MTNLVVIQGPLISSGNDGAGNYKNNYRCFENVINMVKNFQNSETKFILSIWEGESPNDLEKYLPVVKTRDPGPKRTLSLLSNTNDYRQNVSAMAGIVEGIKLFDPKLIVKVRADQYLEIDQIFSHIKKVNESFNEYLSVGQKGYIFFPNFIPWSPYSVGDFYVGGFAEDIKNFYAAQIELAFCSISNFHPWSHSEIVYKYAFIFLRNYLNIPHYYFFPVIGNDVRSQGRRLNYQSYYNSSVLELWDLLGLKSLSFFPKYIASNVFWRGAKFDFSCHQLALFFEEWVENRTQLSRITLESYPNRFRIEKNNILDIFLSFSLEKKLEIEWGLIGCILSFILTFIRSIIYLIIGKSPPSTYFDAIPSIIKGIIKRLRRMIHL